MKKIIAFLLALLMVASLCACAAKEEQTEVITDPGTSEAEENPESTGVTNPMTSYDTLEELNEAVGGKLCRPAVMGVTDESFAKIESDNELIGQYKFAVNGMEYCLRFSPMFDHDISGVYVGDGTAFSDEMPADIEYAETDEMKLARWANIDGQYVLTVTDNGGMDAAQFEGIVNEIEDMTMPNGMGESTLEAYYASLAGEYHDTMSQRATAEVTANGADGVNIKVYWGSSYAEMYMWEMNAVKSEDGLLTYSDCTEKIITLDPEEETESEEIVYENGEGYFSDADGTLCWDGAADEDCVECKFVKN